MTHAVFIFRRDFRIIDNTALNQALLQGCKVVPIFIFNPIQIDPKKNKYYGEKSFEFMLGSLAKLKAELPALRYFCGLDVEVLDAIRKNMSVQSIYFNADVTPFARHRDALLNEWAIKHGVQCNGVLGDYTLIEPSSMVKPYQVFTPFYKKYKDDIVKPNKYVVDIGMFVKASGFPSHHFDQVDDIGDAYEVLKKAKQLKDYNARRDIPSDDDGTTKLSPYLKYGCISIRQAAFALKNIEPLVRQLFWRTFYDQIAWHFPRVLGGFKRGTANMSLREKYDRYEWSNNTEHFRLWKQGKTGFPLVDAGMRQLNASGYMHNRVRMVVASFLIKDLHIDWRWGEQYFAQTLVDYYPTANNGGWGFSSGGGADAMQYNRVFNPWLQSKKYDKECIYIKKWVPELQSIPNKIVHELYLHVDSHIYHKPIVDHSVNTGEYKRKLKSILRI